MKKLYNKQWSCGRKKRFATRAAARNFILKGKTTFKAKVYSCSVCGGFHIAKNKTKVI